MWYLYPILNIKLCATYVLCVTNYVCIAWVEINKSSIQPTNFPVTDSSADFLGYMFTSCNSNTYKAHLHCFGPNIFTGLHTCRGLSLASYFQKNLQDCSYPEKTTLYHACRPTQAYSCLSQYKNWAFFPRANLPMCCFHSVSYLLQYDDPYAEMNSAVIDQVSSVQMMFK